MKGQDGEKVGGYSFFGFAPQLPMLAEGPASVRIEYELFRSGNNSGALLQLLGTAVLLGAIVVSATDASDGWGIGLALGGAIPVGWGTIWRIQASDHLSRAIWQYNRTLR